MAFEKLTPTIDAEAREIFDEVFLHPFLLSLSKIVAADMSGRRKMKREPIFLATEVFAQTLLVFVSQCTGEPEPPGAGEIEEYCERCAEISLPYASTLYGAIEGFRKEEAAADHARAETRGEAHSDDALEVAMAAIAKAMEGLADDEQ